MADEREAHYFHSTLYSFSGKAVEAVIGNFRCVVDNVAVKCYYDKELDVSRSRDHEFEDARMLTTWQGFDLTCPQHIGPDANDALEDAVCKFIHGELEAAEREEVSSSHKAREGCR